MVLGDPISEGGAVGCTQNDRRVASDVLIFELSLSFSVFSDQFFYANTAYIRHIAHLTTPFLEEKLTAKAFLALLILVK